MSHHPYTTFTEILILVECEEISSTVVLGKFKAHDSRHKPKAHGYVERPAGIGPASRAWEARVLPLYDGRVVVPINQGYQTDTATWAAGFRNPAAPFLDLGAR